MSNTLKPVEKCVGFERVYFYQDNYQIFMWMALSFLLINIKIAYSKINK